MYEDMTAQDLVEWESLYAVSPWGEDRAEMLHGLLCSVIDACHRTKGTPEPPIAYMPYRRALDGGAPMQSEDEMKNILESVAQSWGAA